MKNPFDYTDYPAQDGARPERDKSRLQRLNLVKRIRVILNNLRNQKSLALLLRSSGRFLRQNHRLINAFLILFFIAMLEPTLLSHFRIINVKPDALLVTLIILSLFFNLRWSVIFAFSSGIFRDLFTALPFGFNTIICILWVVLVKRISRKLTVENVFVRGTMLYMILLLNSLLMRYALFILDRAISVNAFLRIAIMESILTLLIAIPLYKILENLYKDAQRLQPF